MPVNSNWSFAMDVYWNFFRIVKVQEESSVQTTLKNTSRGAISKLWIRIYCLVRISWTSDMAEIKDIWKLITQFNTYDWGENWCNKCKAHIVNNITASKYKKHYSSPMFAECLCWTVPRLVWLMRVCHWPRVSTRKWHWFQLTRSSVQCWHVFCLNPSFLDKIK